MRFLVAGIVAAILFVLSSLSSGAEERSDAALVSRKPLVSQSVIRNSATQNEASTAGVGDSSSGDANEDVRGRSVAERSSLPLYGLLGGYCALIVTASLAGGWLPNMIRLTHGRMQGMMSVVGGLMLGIALFHMLPHAARHLGSVERTMHWTAGGLLMMFFLIRAFQFHQHGPAEIDDTPRIDEKASGHLAQQTSGHQHHHGHHTGHHHESPSAHRLSWTGVALGLAIHTLLDGLALGASMQADVGHGVVWSLFGLQTFLAILLHKPLDAVSIASLMAAGGWSSGWRNAVNAGFALMCPLGAGLFFLGVGGLAEHRDVLVGCALGFSAGVFLCISLGDLLPEMEWHSHDRLRLSALLLLGMIVAYLIGQSHVHA